MGDALEILIPDAHEQRVGALDLLVATDLVRPVVAVVLAVADVAVLDAELVVVAHDLITGAQEVVICWKCGL